MVKTLVAEEAAAGDYQVRLAKCACTALPGQDTSIATTDPCQQHLTLEPLERSQKIERHGAAPECWPNSGLGSPAALKSEHVDLACGYVDVLGGDHGP